MSKDKRSKMEKKVAAIRCFSMIMVPAFRAKASVILLTRQGKEFSVSYTVGAKTRQVNLNKQPFLREGNGLFRMVKKQILEMTKNPVAPPTVQGQKEMRINFIGTPLILSINLIPTVNGEAIVLARIK